MVGGGAANHPKHPFNHFGRSMFLYRLQVVATDYAARWGRPICMNDMSLIRGGVFDYLNFDFRPPHFEHQNGDNADFRSNNTIIRGDTPSCLGSPVTAEGITWMRDELQAIFGHTDHCREHPGEANEHWHVRDQARAVPLCQ
jgi:hypothetical protein